MKVINKHWLIQHFRFIDPATGKLGHMMCSKKPGDIITDSKGRSYQVQDNYSIKIHRKVIVP